MSLPPSSPRLPSPPPPAEIQLGPKSPLMGPNAGRQGSHIEQTAIDANAKRRIHKGTKAGDMAAGPPLVPLQELDSAFQLQEHLAALHYYHTSSNTTPITRDTAKLLATPPPGIDKTLWLYELCRFLIAQCNSLIVGFLFDTPPCSAATCPEMRASEWQFLCAVHDQPKSCCAIDYCCHTLDWAANVVTNPKIFPSRFVVDSHDKNTAVKNLVNVFRRLHRIFAHAWFQHRSVFWSVENQTGLYVLFKRVCDGYDLLPAENYKLPPEAEGLESGSDVSTAVPERQQQQGTAQIVIAKPQGSASAGGTGPSVSDELIGRTNTRRHIKSSPSTGSYITSVPEADEDDSATTIGVGHRDITNRLGDLRISAVPLSAAGSGAGASGGDDELELASIPVIVDNGTGGPINVTPEMLMKRPSSVIPPPGVAASIKAHEIRLGGGQTNQQSSSHELSGATGAKLELAVPVSLTENEEEEEDLQSEAETITEENEGGVEASVAEEPDDKKEQLEEGDDITILEESNTEDDRDGQKEAEEKKEAGKPAEEEEEKQPTIAEEGKQTSVDGEEEPTSKDGEETKEKGDKDNEVADEKPAAADEKKGDSDESRAPNEN
ncbi:MOB kinase activator-like 4 [Cladorrhinum samala]|uniref:MOB kinase activator-like 4 n=1 Tax=Cladorrhinum samala TaxID=585594 RepID=A0AAV9HW20_9PEZI|nr:MOB kinase activator-like 4 [Cladorrhinum samala]